MTPSDEPGGPASGGWRDTDADSVGSPEGDGPTPAGHRNWLHWLFPAGEGDRVVVVSAVTSAGLFVGLYLVSVVTGVDRGYLDPATVLGLSAYAGSLGIFIELVILGTWATGYTAVWRAVEPSFATDEESYAAFLDARVGRLFETRVVLVVFLAFETPFALVINELNPLLPRDAILTVYNATIVFLAITALWMFVVHFGTMRRAMRLDVANAFTAARTLEPLARFNVNTSVWWFVGLSVLSLYYWLWLSDYLLFLLFHLRVEPTDILPIPVYVHAGLMGLLIAVGIALVAVPLWRIHVALTAAKTELLTDVDEHFSEIVRDWSTGGTSADVATELDAAEKAHESVSRIRTWPYDESGLVKLLVSSVLPLSQFVLTSLLSLFGVE
jgi:hypothetical protein